MVRHIRPSPAFQPHLRKKLNLFAVCLFMQLRAILCLKKKKSSNGFSKNTTQNTPATSWVSRLSLPSRLLRHPLNRSLHKHGTCDGVMPRPIERSGVKLSNRTAHYISVPRLWVTLESCWAFADPWRKTSLNSGPYQSPAREATKDLGATARWPGAWEEPKTFNPKTDKAKCKHFNKDGVNIDDAGRHTAVDTRRP